MDARTLTTASPEETKQFGRDLARELRAGDIVCLSGDLGAGKTTLVQGIAEGLGATTPATSPSFVIVNEYELGERRETQGERKNNQQFSSPSSLLPTASILRHIDLYRLPDPSVDIDRIGLPELLNDTEAITLVEWADRLPKEIPLSRGVISVKLVHQPRGEGREIIVGPS